MAVSPTHTILASFNNTRGCVIKQQGEVMRELECEFECERGVLSVGDNAIQVLL